MKHEYHLTIARTDRIWLIIFVSGLLGWELIKPLIPGLHGSNSMILNAIHADTSIVSDPSDQGKPRKKLTSRTTYDEDQGAEKEKTYTNEEPTPINLMEATRNDLRSIGLTAKVATNIEKYVAAGGVIENERQLMKIYGMDSLQLEMASPYLIFPALKKYPDTSFHEKHNSTAGMDKIIDLNIASAADLERLPGIGTILAERIIKYRNSLGGFLSVHQVGECYGLPPETMANILPMVKIAQPPSLISINKVDLKNFSHPYVNRKMIRIIEAYRNQHGMLNGATDLRKIYPPDTTWCDKLLPYLVFD